jgi:hypothetical protein
MKGGFDVFMFLLVAEAIPARVERESFVSSELAVHPLP